MQKKLLPIVCIIALLAGCKNEAPTQDSFAAPAPEKTTESNQAAESIAAPAPDAKSVLADVYKQSVAEISGSQLSDGRYVGYWSGQQFLHEGKNYFVAFTEATPPSEIEYPTPEDKVTISQATYEFSNGQWQLKNVQDDVGQFGSNNKAPAMDTAGKAVFFHDANGKLFFAVPSVVFANMGIQLFSNELFVLTPENGKWNYLGSIKTGFNNTAGCAHEGDSTKKTKCASSNGTLEFSMVENSSWPELKVLRAGTELDDKGNLVTLSDKDSMTYRYEEKSSGYTKVGR